MLAEQFVIRGAPIPSEAGSRGAGLRLVAAANALAGSGLIIGEKGAGRKRAAASAGGHAAVLADVARRMPLVFLEQVRSLAGSLAAANNSVVVWLLFVSVLKESERRCVWLPFPLQFVGGSAGRVTESS